MKHFLWINLTLGLICSPVLFANTSTSTTTTTTTNNVNTTTVTRTKSNDMASDPKTSAQKNSNSSTPNTTISTSAPASQTSSGSLPEKNLMASNTFLEENKKKQGVIVLPSGLQYKMIKEGAGKSPGPTDFVTVNYKGTLPDGTVFDSSASQHAPVTFALNAVIPGWTEGLQLMKEGGKAIFYVPPQLAYGEKGVGRLIGPNQVLVFEIELIDTDSSISEDFKEKKQESWEDPVNTD